MRTITKDAAAAFWAGVNFKRSNTEVFVDADMVRMYLHDNLIAQRDRWSLSATITHAGWMSHTTKERLNGILSQYSGCIYQRDFTWYINLPGNVPQVWDEDTFFIDSYRLIGRVA